jgi:phosphohistidine phosphatase SixA
METDDPSGMKKPLREMARRPLMAPLLMPVLGLVLIVMAGWMLLEAQATTTVILVRHAEKMVVGDDPGLTDLGAGRARALVRALSEVEISAIYASQFRRTQDTVGPLGRATGLEVTIMDARAPEDLIDRILSEDYGQTVVVAGHSNTVPDLMARLGVDGVPELSESDYDDLFIVAVPWFGEVSMTRLSYGPVEQTETHD